MSWAVGKRELPAYTRNDPSPRQTPYVINLHSCGIPALSLEIGDDAAVSQSPAFSDRSQQLIKSDIYFEVFSSVISRDDISRVR